MSLRSKKMGNTDTFYTLLNIYQDISFRIQYDPVPRYYFRGNSGLKKVMKYWNWYDQAVPYHIME